MAQCRSVVVVSDYNKTRKTIKETLTEAIDCHCSIECVDRDELNKRRSEIKTRPTNVVFAFPRQERILIYDKSDPYNTFQQEIDAVGIHQTMIFVQYKDDVDDATLIHSDLVKSLRYGPQKDLLPYLEQGRVLSLKGEFNAIQWAKIETLFELPIKEEIKRRKEKRRLQLEKGSATKMQREQAQREEKQAKIKEKEEKEASREKANKTKHGTSFFEDDKEAQCTEQPRLELFLSEQKLKEIIGLFEEILKDKFTVHCIDVKGLQRQWPWKRPSAHFKKHTKHNLQQQLQRLNKDVLEGLEQTTEALFSELAIALKIKPFEDDKEAQSTKQPKPLEENIFIPGEQKLKEIIGLFEKIPKDKFIDQCIDFKTLRPQLPWKYKSSHFKKHVKDHLQQQLRILSKEVLEALKHTTQALHPEITAALKDKEEPEKVRLSEFDHRYP